MTVFGERPGERSCWKKPFQERRARFLGSPAHVPCVLMAPAGPHEPPLQGACAVPGRTPGREQAGLGSGYGPVGSPGPLPPHGEPGCAKQGKSGLLLAESPLPPWAGATPRTSGPLILPEPPPPAAPSAPSPVPEQQQKDSLVPFRLHCPVPWLSLPTPTQPSRRGTVVCRHRSLRGAHRAGCGLRAPRPTAAALGCHRPAQELSGCGVRTGPQQGRGRDTPGAGGLPCGREGTEAGGGGRTVCP